MNPIILRKLGYEYLKVTQKSSGDNFNLIFHLTTNFQFIILKIKMSPETHKNKILMKPIILRKL